MGSGEGPPRRRSAGRRFVEFLGEAAVEAVVCGVGIAVVSLTVWGWHAHRIGTVVIWSAVLGVGAFGLWSTRPGTRLRRTHPLIAFATTVVLVLGFLVISLISCGCWWLW